MKILQKFEVGSLRLELSCLNINAVRFCHNLETRYFVTALVWS
jgi:hypothetical protein